MVVWELIALEGRGARMISESGGSLARLLTAGQWRPSAYRLYPDLGAVEASGDKEGRRTRAAGAGIPLRPKAFGIRIPPKRLGWS